MIDSNIITLIKFLFLGILQGFTEPLPISSSGHLIVMRDIFNIYTSGLTFEIIVHLGSLFAIILVYWKDIKQLIIDNILFLIKRNKTYFYSFKLFILLLISSSITGIIGLTVEEFISDTFVKPLFVGLAFIITSFFIWQIRNLEGHKAENRITVKDAIIIGLAQSLSLVPGISRSGATIVAAMFLGLRRLTALRFSFLLFIPISIGINILSLKSIINDPTVHTYAIPYVVAFLAAFISTYYALKLFIQVMKRGYLKLFAAYCFTLGVLVILWQFISKLIPL